MTSDASRTTVVRLAHVRCAYGGSGVSARGSCAIMPYFDVTAVHPVSGLRMADLEVFEGARLLGRANAPIQLRLSLPGRDRDHNLITQPFEGFIAAGATVRLVAAAELAGLPEEFWGASCRYRARLVVASTEGDETFLFEGSLDDPWPTAGPTLSR